MTQDQKKPEESGIFDELKGVLREEFEQTRKDVDMAIDGAMHAAHFVGKQARDTYKVVEDTVGRDRLWGAGFGAKVIGGFAATKFHAAIPLYIAQVGVGTVVGGAIGFAAGPWLAKRYRRANNGADVANENDEAAPPPEKTPVPPGP